mmetsp:Transcript_50868/g.75375  ORF Transcript_50868/g.75375 Transcript_50868/m.75375 type:complete len:568 (+) Transcript_50868:56-1759(+)|eukprot:CAMPEP_0195528352 /NCGR_PEP_ID=MMETSP0794_2-20130614/30452_1 /TAXON_ID=515487 /ORGANISM="Stephanopyxis turris, Strain CCMP 815" /LENGTH=567 /DNA_ID=CAMNT_0040659475 /DNA_START=55 /DNA_END=1758 /DNA_ORIENTATION=+
MADFIPLVESAISALINESGKANENIAAIQELARLAEESIKPQLDEISSVIQEGNSSEDGKYEHITEALSVLHNAVVNAKGVVQKRGRKRTFRQRPLDALKGKAAKIEAEINNAEKLLMQGIHNLTLALGIQMFKYNKRGSNGQQAEENADDCPWKIQEKDIFIERNKRGKPIESAVLGSGGFGTVVRGLYRGKVEVAVKEPHNACLINSDPKLVKAFFREATSLYRINHSNIVDFYGAIELDDDGQPVYAIVTEVLDVTLDEYLLKHNDITIEKRRAIIQGVINGLGFLHSMGIIHRDLKPQNIMMDKEDVPKIIDFGLSKQKEEIQMTQNSTRLAGTESWMAPEKKRGERSTPASDMYSFGLLGYFILTGKKPSVDMTQNNIESDLHLLCRMDEDDIYPRLILQCIDKERTKRPASATLAMYLFREEIFRGGGGSIAGEGQSVALGEVVTFGETDTASNKDSEQSWKRILPNFMAKTKRKSLADTIVELKKSLTSLEEREAKLEQMVKESVNEAKERYAKNDKKGALQSFKRKNVLKSRLEKIENEKMSFETEIMNLESALQNSK